MNPRQHFSPDLKMFCPQSSASKVQVWLKIADWKLAGLTCAFFLFFLADSGLADLTCTYFLFHFCWLVRRFGKSTTPVNCDAWRYEAFCFDIALIPTEVSKHIFTFCRWWLESFNSGTGQEAGSKNATLLNKSCEKWNPGAFNWPRCDLERKLKWHLCKHQIAPGCVQI